MADQITIPAGAGRDWHGAGVLTAEEDRRQLLVEAK
jgi:hypothetical protein